METVKRRFSEVDAGTIPAENFIHIPLQEVPEALTLSDSEFEDQFGAPKPKENDQILFYCMAGVRSRNAALQFELGCPQKYRKNFVESFWHPNFSKRAIQTFQII